MLAAKFAESQSSAVETELSLRTPALQISIAPEHRAAMKQQGFAIIPKVSQRQAAA